MKVTYTLPKCTMPVDQVTLLLRTGRKNAKYLYRKKKKH